MEDYTAYQIVLLSMTWVNLEVTEYHTSKSVSHIRYRICLQTIRKTYAVNCLNVVRKLKKSKKNWSIFECLH